MHRGIGNDQVSFKKRSRKKTREILLERLKLGRLIGLYLFGVDWIKRNGTGNSRFGTSLGREQAVVNQASPSIGSHHDVSMQQIVKLHPHNSWIKWILRVGSLIYLEYRISVHEQKSTGIMNLPALEGILQDSKRD
jgi:hypothetical protein